MSSQDTNAVENKAKLYVGNLPYTMREEDLSELFAEFGEIKQVTLIIDKMSGRSKGFGFVEFVSEDSATQAVEAMNGRDVDGRALVVNVARPPQPRTGGFRNDRGGSGGGGGRRFDNRSRGGYSDSYGSN